MVMKHYDKAEIDALRRAAIYAIEQGRIPDFIVPVIDNFNRLIGTATTSGHCAIKDRLLYIYIVTTEIGAEWVDFVWEGLSKRYPNSSMSVEDRGDGNIIVICADVDNRETIDAFVLAVQRSMPRCMGVDVDREYEVRP